MLDQQDGLTVLVGHSYGGTVITAASTHPKVQVLVYVAAFQPEQGATTADLFAAKPLAARPSSPQSGALAKAAYY